MKLKEKKFFLVIIFLAIIIRVSFLSIPGKTYADEGEYVVDARIILKGKGDPNWTHPPLGKLIIAASMAILGDNPIGWRFPNFIFSVISIAIFYFFCKELTKNENISLFATCLLSLDFMHLQMSKIGMLDMMFFAFTIAGFYFISKNKPNYILSGILFGLGLSVKWTAFLGIIVALVYMFLNKQFRLKKVFFILFIPFVVYVLTFTQYFLEGKSIFGWFSEQIKTLEFHATMKGPTRKLDVLLWLAGQPGFLVWEKDEISINRASNRSISLIGNPIVWIPGFIATFLLFFKKRDNVVWFLVVCFVLFYLPWLILPRTNVYIYYMLLVTPVFCLAISKILFEKYRKFSMIYFILVLISFILYFPVLVGI